MGTVVVVNKNGEEYAKQFDGELYRFPPNEPVTIPEVAAMFFFAYGQGDKERERILISNGWQKNGIPGDPSGPDEAMKKLKKFIFKKGPEQKAAEPPEKLIAPSQREPTGINAISPHARNDGRTILPRGPVGLPGSSGPLVPSAAPAS